MWTRTVSQPSCCVVGDVVVVGVVAGDVVADDMMADDVVVGDVVAGDLVAGVVEDDAPVPEFVSLSSHTQ